MRGPAIPVGMKGRQILPWRHDLPAVPMHRLNKTPYFIEISSWHGACSLLNGCYRPCSAAFVGSSDMLIALSAASSAIDLLKSLTSTNSPVQGPGFDPTAATSSTASATTSGTASTSSPALPGNGISTETMKALLAVQGQSSGGPTGQSKVAALKDLFSQLDVNGDGQVSKSEFEDTLGAGGTNVKQADNVFSQLDTDGDGSVSMKELASALKGGHKGHHGHRAGNTDDSGENPLLQALDGATGTSTTNSDGSTTTSLTYADGSTVTLTTPAAKTASSAATSSYNLIEQMIQRDAQAISASATQSLSVSV
jgi:EF-hand domain pair